MHSPTLAQLLSSSVVGGALIGAAVADDGMEAALRRVQARLFLDAHTVDTMLGSGLTADQLLRARRRLLRQRGERQWYVQRL